MVFVEHDHMIEQFASLGTFAFASTASVDGVLYAKFGVLQTAASDGKGGLSHSFKLAFAGCHLTTHIPSTITNCGFKIDQITEGYLAPFPKCGTYCFRGVARPGPI